MKRWRKRLETWWFLLGLLVAVGCGASFSRAGQELREVPGLIGGLVATILFLSGLGLETGRLARGVRNLRAILWAVTTTYAVGPLAGIGLALLCRPGGDAAVSQDFVAAVVLASAQASTLAAAIALTKAARGDAELALVLTVISNLSTAFLTPWILRLALGVGVTFSTAEMTGRIVLVVVLPVIVGYAVRALTRKRFPDLPERTRLVPQAIILFFAYIAFASAADALREEIALAARFLVAAVGLHVALASWSFLGARILRLDRDASIAVFYCGSQKTVPNGIYLWKTYFAANPLGAVPLVCVQLVQLVVGYLLVPAFLRGAKRGERGDGEGSRFGDRREE